MTFLELKAFINTWIYTNGANEITAATLNPVLQAMADWANGTIGNLSDLSTADKTSVVNAINELQGLIAAFENSGIQLHQGTDNPNITPPSAYSIADFYIEVDVDNNPVQLYQYNGAIWDTPDDHITDLQTVLDNGNTADIGFTIDNGLSNLLVLPNEVNISNPSGNTAFMNPDDGFVSGDGAGKQVQLHSDGLRLSTNGDGFSARIKNDITTSNLQVYQLPDKADGTYTIATTEDVTGGVVDSVNGTSNQIDVDSSDPANPVIGLPPLVVINELKVDTDVEVTGDLTADEISATGDISGANLSGINTGDQTSIVGIAGTKSEFDTAVTDGNFLYVGDVTQYTDAMAKAAAVSNSITDGVTDVAPSQNAVFDALALKAEADIFLRLTSPNTLTSNTSAQNIFTANSGEITLPEGLYDFTMIIYGSNFSGTTGFISLGFAGTATVDSILYNAIVEKAASTSGGVNAPPILRLSTVASQITASNANTICFGNIHGSIAISAQGTIIPQITMSQASAAVLQANTKITLTKIGAYNATNN